MDGEGSRAACWEVLVGQHLDALTDVFVANSLLYLHEKPSLITLSATITSF